MDDGMERLSPLPDRRLTMVGRDWSEALPNVAALAAAAAGRGAIRVRVARRLIRTVGSAMVKY